MGFIEIISVGFLFLVYFILIIKSIVKLKMEKFSVAIPVVFVLLIFFVLPIFYDLNSGFADFRNYPGFGYAQNYEIISIVYNVYIGLIGVMLLIYIDRKTYRLSSESQSKLIYYTQKYSWILWFILALPIAILPFMPDPLAYFDYKAVLGSSQDFKDGHELMSKVCFFSILSSSLLIHFVGKGSAISLAPKYITYFIFTFLAIWIFGKRSIVAEYIVLMLTSGWVLGIYKAEKLMKKALIYSLLLGIFIISYGKDIYEGDTSRTYTASRLNYGRDHVVKFTLYKELIDDSKPILNYRGESFLFDLMFFVPRSVWPDKPYPYAVYLTTSVFDTNKEPMGWGFTTSILEETIANFGLFGLFIGPYLLLLFCRAGDGSGNLIIKILTVLILSLLLILHLAAFMSVFLMYLALLLKDKFANSKYKIVIR